ncbi:MAG: IS1182 family transposase [Bacilli bacterium]|nr:IS1182 family transposase [Bacilli bacterium]
MISINRNIQSEILITTMEELVPQESLFRKIDKYIDFTFIYEKVEHLYSKDNGRPSIDPVILFKLVFIQTIDGIKSMRKTCEKIKVDAEYRWFLGIPFGNETPHFSTFSKNYERRFKDSKIFEEIFIEIVNQAIKYKLVDGKILYTDSTHKKANANKNKYEDKIEIVAKKRREWLEEEINEERRKQGKKEFEYKEEYEEKHTKESTTDKESGYYHRDNKEKGFMYLDHRTVDHKANIIVDAHVTKGNVHDSLPYTDRLDYIETTYNFKIEKVAIDSGYDTLDIKKYLHDKNIFGVIGYRRYGTKESREEKRKYYYLKDIDVYVEKETGEILQYFGKIDRNGYKTYTNIEKDKKISRHIKQDLNDKFIKNRLSEEGKKLYKFRKEKVERSFADSKQNHGYRYAMYKGIKKNQHYTWLICAAQNMKNIALKREKVDEKASTYNYIFVSVNKLVKNVGKTFFIF